MTGRRRTLIVALSAAACSLPFPAAAQDTPSHVVVAFYAACNDGEYSKAEKFATKESLDYIKTTFAIGGGFKGYCDGLTEDGTVTRVEVLGEKTRREGAHVDIKFHYKGGTTLEGREELLKLSGGWKIQLLGQISR